MGVLLLNMKHKMDLHHELDELFYATFPNARPSLHSALVAAEHARMFMPPEFEARFSEDIDMSTDTHPDVNDVYPGPAVTSKYWEQEILNNGSPTLLTPQDMPSPPTTSTPLTGAAVSASLEIPAPSAASFTSMDCSPGTRTRFERHIGFDEPPFRYEFLRGILADAILAPHLPTSSNSSTSSLHWLGSPFPPEPATATAPYKKPVACLFCRKRKIACVAVCEPPIQAQCK